MSKNIKVHLFKSIHNSKLETLLNSYTSLKSILSPNLSENNNMFINSLIDLIISQLKIFQKLLSIKDDKNIYTLLISNNQNLSKKIANLYELPRTDPDILYNNKNRSYSIEEKRESFHENNIDNFELYDLYHNHTESKADEINNNTNNVNNNTNQNNDIIEEKIENGSNNDKSENKEHKRGNYKFIKINKSTKDKNMIQSLNLTGYRNDHLNNKKKEKSIKVNIQKNMKNAILNKTSNKKEKEDDKNNNNYLKRNVKSIIFNNKNKKYLNSSKSSRYDYSSFRNKKDNVTKKLFDNKENEKYKKISTIIKSDTKNKNKKEKIFKRKEIKSKTVIYRTIPIPFLIEVTTQNNNNTNDKKNNNNNYISITFTNRILPRVKTPKSLYCKHKLIKMKNNKRKTSSTNSSFKNIKKKNTKLNSAEHFSLNEFLIPHTNKSGEKLFYTKTGKVLINKKQKDILEDYVNNYLCEEEISKTHNTGRKDKDLSHKNIKEKILNIKQNKNKNFVIKGTNKTYNLKDVTDLLQLLPESFNGPIDDFYLKKKRASIFDRSIFRICHKVIDNYKKMEVKENSFSTRKSNSKNKIKIN